MLTSDEPAPVALVGELLATQAQARGVAGILVDGAVRDLDELAAIGLPIWARFVRAQGATKGEVGKLDVPVVVGGAEIRPGDLVVMDCDGAMALPSERVDEVLPLALERGRRERALRQRYAAGELSYDVNGLREIVEGLMEVAVLGLGEAGGRIAADLVAAGCTVRGWDPARRPDGIANAASDLEAVAGADVVLSLNAAAVALDAAASVAARARRGRALRRPEHGLARAEARARATRCRCRSPTSRWSASSRTGLRRPRSPPERAPSASPSSSGRSACRSTSSAPQPGRRRRAEAPAQRLHEGHRGGRDREPRGGARRRRRGARPRATSPACSASRCSSGCSRDRARTPPGASTRCGRLRPTRGARRRAAGRLGRRRVARSAPQFVTLPTM